MLVVLHHAALTYGNIPLWFYTEPAQDPTGAALDLLVMINQTFFMGMFFLFAGYFVPGSTDRRGRRGFVRERLVRLGAPLLLFVLLVRPLVLVPGWPRTQEFLAAEGMEMPFWLYHVVTFDPGPMWFVEVLLVFSLAYVVVRSFLDRRGERATSTVEPPPRPEADRPLRWAGPLLVLTLGLVLVTFTWRYLFPAPYWPVVGLPSPGYLPQYAMMFVLGVLAHRNNWCARLPDRALWWGVAVAVSSLVLYPMVGGLLGEAAQTPGSWQALAVLVPEMFLGAGVAVALLVFFRRFLNRGNRLSRYLADNAFAVYFLHPLVLVYLAAAFGGWDAMALAKFALLAVAAVPVCWALAGAVRALPGVKRVL